MVKKADSLILRSRKNSLGKLLLLVQKAVKLFFTKQIKGQKFSVHGGQNRFSKKKKKLKSLTETSERTRGLQMMKMKYLLSVDKIQENIEKKNKLVKERESASRKVSPIASG